MSSAHADKFIKDQWERGSERCENENLFEEKVMEFFLLLSTKDMIEERGRGGRELYLLPLKKDLFEYFFK